MDGSDGEQEQGQDLGAGESPDGHGETGRNGEQRHPERGDSDTPSDDPLEGPSNQPETSQEVPAQAQF